MSDDKAFIDEMKRRDARHGSMIGSIEEVREIVEQYAAIGVDELIVPDYNLGSKEQRIATMDAIHQGRGGTLTLRIAPTSGRRRPSFFNRPA